MCEHNPKIGKRLFKIGEISRLFGIGLDSIRYYEKMGILQPTRNKDNNYRLYTVEDIRKMTMIRELLNLNFSLKQIKEFESKRNIQNTISLLEQELHVVDDSILKLYETRNSIQSRLNSFHQNLGNKEFEKVVLKTLFERPCVMISEDNLPDAYVDYYLVKYMRSRQKRIDTIGACDCYTLDVQNSSSDSAYYRTKNVFFYSNTMAYESNYILPAGQYLSLSYSGSLKKTKKFVPIMYQYAQSHKLKVVGEPIEFCLIDDYETADENEFLTELQLAVKSGRNRDL